MSECRPEYFVLTWLQHQQISHKDMAEISVYVLNPLLQNWHSDSLAVSKIRTRCLINFKYRKFHRRDGKIKYWTQAADNTLLCWKQRGSVKAYLHELGPICTLEQQNNCVQLASPVHFMAYWHMPLVASRLAHCTYTDRKHTMSEMWHSNFLPDLSPRRSANVILWAWSSSGTCFCWKYLLETYDRHFLWMTWLVSKLYKTKIKARI